MGGAGDDVFVPGMGDDGINGSAGNDRVVFSGLSSEYSFAVEGAGYRVIGPDGSDFLINVEALGFDDVEYVTFAEMTLGPDGQLTLPETLLPPDEPTPEIGDIDIVPDGTENPPPEPTPVIEDIDFVPGGTENPPPPTPTEIISTEVIVDLDMIVDDTRVISDVALEGDFMAVASGGDTIVTFETFLPSLAETRAVNPSDVNGINNQAFLTAVEDGHALGFFIVQDGASWAAGRAATDTFSFLDGSGGAANIGDPGDALLAVNGIAAGREVFHSFDLGLNADGVQHALSGVVLGGRSITIGFEDLTGGGDLNYQDVVFSAESFDVLA